jgi:hypothetical protein
MFAVPVRVPSRAIAGRGERPVVEGQIDHIQPSPLHLRRQRGAILTPDVAHQPLLLVIVVAPNNGFFRGHHVHIAGGKRAKCGKEG